MGWGVTTEYRESQKMQISDFFLALLVCRHKGLFILMVYIFTVILHNWNWINGSSM